MANERGGEPRRRTANQRVANMRRRPKPASQPRAGRGKGLASAAPPLGSTRVAGFAPPQLGEPYDPWNKGVDPARTPFPSLAPEPEVDPEFEPGFDPGFDPGQSAVSPARRMPRPPRDGLVLAPPKRRRFAPGRVATAAALAVVTAAVVAAAAIWFVKSADSNDSPSAARPPAAGSSAAHSVDPARATALAVRWVKDNVAKDTAVFAPASTLADLRTGMPRATAVPTPSAVPEPGYVLSTTALRANAAASSAVAAVLAASLPVARFGSGAARVEVRQVSPDGLASLQQRRMQDLGYRKLAGTELLRNPHVQVSKDARDQLARGDLDLRAETLLAVLANSTHVDVLAIRDDPAEDGFGMPARTLVVTIARRPPLRAAVASMPSASKPTVTSLSGEQRQLSWQLSVTRLETLQ
jgi:hypothetical protein